MAIATADKIVTQSVLNYYLTKINTACKTNYIKKQMIDSEVDLPVVGDEMTIYFTREGAIYAWDKDNLKYVDINPNYSCISGGSATS